MFPVNQTPKKIISRAESKEILECWSKLLLKIPSEKQLFKLGFWELRWKNCWCRFLVLKEVEQEGSEPLLCRRDGVAADVRSPCYLSTHSQHPSNKIKKQPCSWGGTPLLAPFIFVFVNAHWLGLPRGA